MEEALNCEICTVLFVSPAVAARRAEANADGKTAAITCPNGHINKIEPTMISMVRHHLIVSERERDAEGWRDRHTELEAVARKTATEARAAKALVVVLQQKLDARPRQRRLPAPAQLALPEVPPASKRGRRG